MKEREPNREGTRQKQNHREICVRLKRTKRKKRKRKRAERCKYVSTSPFERRQMCENLRLNTHLCVAVAASFGCMTVRMWVNMDGKTLLRRINRQLHKER